MKSIFLSGAPDGHAECGHWLGVKYADIDCEGWLRFLEAETVGMEPKRKITIPLVVPEDTLSCSSKQIPALAFNVARHEPDLYDANGNTNWPTYLWDEPVAESAEGVA
jgi:hypothetical protein